MAALSIDHMSGGRMILGLGVFRAASGGGLVRATLRHAGVPAPAST